MPNLVIETSHSSLVQQPDILLANINQSLWQSGCFKLAEDIKSRIHVPNAVAIGTDSPNDHKFIMVHFYLIAGRDKATIDDLTQRIATAIQQYFINVEKIDNFENTLQICINPMVLSECYRKVIW